MSNIPTATAKVSIVYLRPSIIAASVCPHCEELQCVEIEKEQERTKILHACTSCGDTYYFRKSKK